MGDACDGHSCKHAVDWPVDMDLDLPVDSISIGGHRTGAELGPVDAGCPPVGRCVARPVQATEVSPVVWAPGDLVGGVSAEQS